MIDDQSENNCKTADLGNQIDPKLSDRTDRPDNTPKILIVQGQLRDSLGSQ
jgi:hypothetical protein